MVSGSIQQNGAKPPKREVISIDSDSDSHAPAAASRRPSNSKIAVQPGTYAHAPKYASAYIPSPHFHAPQLHTPQISASIESNGNGYAKVSDHSNSISSSIGQKLPTDRQLEKMPAMTMDVNEVFENQSVTTTADHLDRDNGDTDGEREEDDDKTLFDESFPEIGDDALLNSGECCGPSISEKLGRTQ